LDKEKDKVRHTGVVSLDIPLNAAFSTKAKIFD